jgi:hypothetical protein
MRSLEIELPEGGNTAGKCFSPVGRCKPIEVTYPKWQLCSFSMRETSLSRGSWKASGRARSVYVFYRAKGSQSFIDRRSAWVQLSLDEVKLIPLSATEEEFKKENCSYAGGSGGSINDVETTCVPAGAGAKYGIQTCRDYVIDAATGGRKYTGTPYTCGPCMFGE